jgi:hypothetical protein
MSAQIQGFGSTIAEVESATRALRATLRPTDPGALGSYKKALNSGTMAAGLGANSPVFSFRYAGANLCLIKRVGLSLGDLAGFTAGLMDFNIFVARSFTASDSGGTPGTLTGNNGKLRTSYATTGVADIRISSTATLTAGTRTLDADPQGVLSISAIATAGQPMVPLIQELFRAFPGEQPLVLAPNEGFVIQALVPATGTWQFGVETTWDEVASW